MSLTQRELYSKYNNVMIVDTTYNTNWFQMMLCIITIIDNNYRTWIVTCAIIEDKTLDTYKWIFENILIKIGSSSRIIFTNSDPSITQLIKDIYSNVQHILCIFHIDLNLWKKLKKKLCSQFKKFYHKFYIC